ncbi:MAG: hypothetical protein Q7T18_01475 [Sedimentisphaerales bacterium]|nr:hypothetical protein [Sedimentisphaerales bacterium]
MEKTQKSKFEKTRWLLLIDGAVSLIMALVIVILLRHKPADYHPELLFDKPVSPYLTHQLLPQFYNGMQKKEPFEMIIEQKGLNEAIAAIGWPQMFNGLLVSTPVISIAPRQLRLRAMINYNGIDTVATVEIVPRIDDKGLLHLDVENVKMGALGVTYITKKLAKKIFNEQIQYIEPDNIASLTLASLMAEKPFEPVFAVEGEKARIDYFILRKEMLEVHIVPIEKQVGVR